MAVKFTGGSNLQQVHEVINLMGQNRLIVIDFRDRNASEAFIFLINEMTAGYSRSVFVFVNEDDNIKYLQSRYKNLKFVINDE